MSHIDILLNRLEGVKTNNNNRWLARCPAHQDRSPSLAIKLVEDDKILLKCWAGCDTLSILEAIGLTFSDLFPEKITPDYSGKRPKLPRFNTSELFPLLVQESILLAIAINSLTGNPLNNPNYFKADFNAADLQRVVTAFATIINLHAECKG